MPQRLVRIACVPVLVMVGAVTLGAGSAGTSPKPDKPKALCQFVSSAKDKDDQAAVDFDAGQARDSLRALRNAAKLSLPGDLKDAIKQLMPLYEALARSGRGDAFTQLDNYATKNCGFTNAEDIDACALVSQEDAEALAATPLEPAAPGAGTCVYAGQAGGPTASVEVYVGDGAKSYYDVDRGVGELVPIADLGDEAYLAPSGDVVYFQSSGVWVVIHVIRLEGDFAQPLEALAREVVAKL